MKAIHVLLVGLAVMALTAGKGVEAQGWSDEVRLTYFEEDGLSTFYFKKDYNDNLHFLYTIGDWGEEDRCQAVYQQFNRIGEPLTDPIVISEVANVPDTTEFGNRAVDLFLDNDGVIHILSCTFHYDTNYRFYYSKLDIDGNALGNAVLLEKLGDIPYYPSDHPYNMVVDSRDNIIIGGGSHHFFGDTTRSTRVFYQRYNMEGEPVEEMHFLDQRSFEYWSSMKITTNDTLLFVWSENDQSVNYVYYCKVAPNDSIIVDNFNVRADDGWGSVNFIDFEMDNENRLVLLLNSGHYIYLRKYNSIMNRMLQVTLGEYYWRMGDISIDKEYNIHVGIGFETEEGTRYVGYSQIDNEGNLLDSAVVIWDREINRNAYWHQVMVFACSDVFTGVLWRDTRWGPYQQEIFLRYKISQSVNNEFNDYLYPDNPIIYSIYPNPFNSSTLIHFSIPYSNFSELQVFDNNGRIVFSQDIQCLVDCSQFITWEGVDVSGLPLPSGSYLIRLNSGNRQTVKKVQLIR